MRQEAVEILTTLVDDRSEADDFGASAHDDEKFQLPVIFKLCHFTLIYVFFYRLRRFYCHTEITEITEKAFGLFNIGEANKISVLSVVSV
jgi:hypothetical protein